ncbi:MAG TPA: hypothetical protein VI136_15060 [Verrucomicrobiae bacterium]
MSQLPKGAFLLAESPDRVTLKLYLELIAAVLFQLNTGRRPNRRVLELFQ